MVGEETAPKRPPSHSALSVSTVFCGNAAPVFWKVSKPASRSTKEKSKGSKAERASRTRRPAWASQCVSSEPLVSRLRGTDRYNFTAYTIAWYQTYSEASRSHCCLQNSGGCLTSHEIALGFETYIAWRSDNSETKAGAWTSDTLTSLNRILF